MFFWKNDKIELRMIEKNDCSNLEKYLKDTKSRFQPEHGVALPVTMQDATSMIENAQHW